MGPSWLTETIFTFGESTFCYYLRECRSSAGSWTTELSPAHTLFHHGGKDTIPVGTAISCQSAWHRRKNFRAGVAGNISATYGSHDLTIAYSSRIPEVLLNMGVELRSIPDVPIIYVSSMEVTSIRMTNRKRTLQSCFATARKAPRRWAGPYPFPWLTSRVYTEATWRRNTGQLPKQRAGCPPNQVDSGRPDKRKSIR